MTTRGTLVDFLLAGLALLAQSSLVPRVNLNGPKGVACNAHRLCGYVPREILPSDELTYYSVRERRGERFSF
jgi:hypothetical protein